jgi:hypothetical protein
MAAPILQPWLDAEPYRVTLVTELNQIQRLAIVSADLLASTEKNCHPGFFLASVTKEWKPYIAVVRQRRNIVGMVYGKERRIAGIGTGVVYIDATLGAPLMGSPLVRERVFQSAARGFLHQPGLRALRFVVSPSGPEISGLQAYAAANGKVEINTAPVENNSVLRLPFSYEAFLQQLGRQTRRNFRYYRRKSEAAGHYFVSRVPQKAFQYGAWQMVQKRVAGADLESVKRVSSMLAQAPDPLIMGLRDSSGAWLSLAAGWYERGRAVLMMQLNDTAGYPKASLSTVLRSYMVEHLIRYDVRELVCCGGIGSPLKQLAITLPAASVHLDKRLPYWQMVRWGVRAASKYLPPTIAAQADWVAMPKVA